MPAVLRRRQRINGYCEISGPDSALRAQVQGDFPIGRYLVLLELLREPRQTVIACRYQHLSPVLPVLLLEKQSIALVAWLQN